MTNPGVMQQVLGAIGKVLNCTEYTHPQYEFDTEKHNETKNEGWTMNILSCSYFLKVKNRNCKDKLLS